MRSARSQAACCSVRAPPSPSRRKDCSAPISRPASRTSSIWRKRRAIRSDLVSAEAASLATRAGAVEIQVKTERADKVFEQPTGLRIFIESTIAATAFGRPGLAA
ncbi:MAG: hypothetical protein HC868_18120 [Sphingomonadales bacterium]|nr:hypothetical protein [Sphingomonadales bacterium]